jgi:hypothetical protein
LKAKIAASTGTNDIRDVNHTAKTSPIWTP